MWAKPLIRMPVEGPIQTAQATGGALDRWRAKPPDSGVGSRLAAEATASDSTMAPAPVAAETDRPLRGSRRAGEPLIAANAVSGHDSRLNGAQQWRKP